jgi:hypothetical protein
MGKMNTSANRAKMTTGTIQIKILRSWLFIPVILDKILIELDIKLT